MQCCAHIHAGTQYVISQSNDGHDMDTNHANMIFNVLKYKDSITYVLWYGHHLF